MPDLGKLTVKLIADSTQFRHGLSQAEGALSSFGPSLLAVGAMGGAALMGLGVMSLKVAGEFEAAMSEVKAVSGATADQFARLDALALQLGKDTAYSAGEAAKGIGELVKGGIAIEDVLSGAAKSMLDLAAAGGVTLPEAAEIAANAMAMFGLKGEDMARVADLVAGAANASSLSVGDFRYSLAMSGAVARTAGQSFDSLAQGIAVLGRQGLKGSDAGTSLKTMLMNLIPSTAKATAEMEKLGIITADGANKFIDAQGKVKSMAEIAGVLKGATEGLTEAQKLASLEIIFGSDAIRAAAIFAREGAEGFGTMADAMGKVTAADVAATKLDNLRGSMEQLKGSFETFLIVVGKVLIPALRPIVDMATQALNTITNLVQAFQSGEKSATELGGTLSKVTEGLTQVRLAGQALAAFLSAEMLPVIAELRAAFSEWLSEVAPLAQAAFDNVMRVIGPILTGLVAFIQEHGHLILDIFRGVWLQVQGIFQVAFAIIGAYIKVFLAILAGDFDAAGAALQEGWQGVMDGFTKIFKGWALVFGSAWRLAWEGYKAVVLGVCAAVEGAVKTSLNWLVDRVNDVITRMNAIRITIPTINLPFGRSVGGGSIGVPQIAAIPRLAEGGIITAPTLAMLHPREAVIPLGRMDRMKTDRPIQIIFEGPVYGFDDFEDRVVMATERATRRGRM